VIKFDKAAGTQPGQRQLNGPQTTGRTYANLSEPEFEIDTTNANVRIPMRDGVELMADLYLPRGQRAPALLAASPYPRQIQNCGAPMGFVEAGATDFWVPRGYAHVILNARGTNGSGGVYDCYGTLERHDLYDAIEWLAAQPWCDGNVGMIGISAFAMSQLAAAAEQPPHLRAIFPVAVSADSYEAIWHNGVLSATFALHWLRAVGIFAELDDAFLRGKALTLASELLRTPRLHHIFAHLNGESALGAFDLIVRKSLVGPWNGFVQAASIEHTVKDAFWQERDSIPRLSRIRVPVYLGCDWENVPMHLASTFASMRALSPDVPFRVALLGKFGLTWPWESLHVEALAWYDHWIKGRDTGIMDGPPIRYVIPGESDERWHEAPAWPPAQSATATFALCGDGTLASDEGPAGTRSYAYHASDADLYVKEPSLLEWTTAPLDADLWLAGPGELVLDASSSGGDTAFLLALQDVAPDGSVVDVTAGWRRAAISDDNTTLGAVPAGQMCRYRIKLVDNARRFARGHRVRLIVRSDDQGDPAPIMGFRHAAVGTTTRIDVASSSRLTLTTIAGE
jgi:predicted acyl esterase